MRFSRLAVLCLCPLLVLAVAGFDWFSYEGSFHRSLAVSGPVQMTVQTGSGSIHVTRGAAATVTVDAHIRGRYQDRVQEIERNPPVHQEGNIIEIGKLPDDLGRNVSISYEITTPADTTVKVSSGSGNDAVAGLAGSVRAETGSGSIDLQDIGSDITASTGSGSVSATDVHGAARVSSGSGSIAVERVGGEARANTGSGEISITAPGGPVNADTGSGTIRVNQVHAAVHAHTGSGGVRVEGSLPAGAQWNVQSGSGDIELQLPASAAAEVDAYTGSGSIVTSRPLSVQGAINRHQVRGFMNEAAPGNGALIVARTSSGTIRIH